jgi:putative YhbY family RNA-binding protein
MPALQLSPAQRKALRADAHHLDAVVAVGADGLTPAVAKEADAALKAHGLIKVRVFSDDRQAREDVLARLCDQLDAAPVQHIGKLLVLWRPLPVKAAAPRDNAGAAPKKIKVLKYSKRGGQRPQVKVVTVLGNQRLTAGGTVKRARARTVSPKKRA